MLIGWRLGTLDHSSARALNFRVQLAMSRDMPFSLCLERHGNVCRIWDMLSGGQLLGCLANHQKTVTSLCTANSAGPAATSAPRLLSGSLDGHVKVPAPAQQTHF